MLFPQTMLKTKLFIPNDKVYKEIENIGRSSLLHVDKTHKNLFFANLQNRTHLLLKTIHKHMDTLNIQKREYYEKDIDSFEEEIFTSTEMTRDIGFEIEKLSNEKKSLEKELKEINLAQKISDKLTELDLKSLKSLKMFKIYIAIIPEEFFEFFKLSTNNYPLFVVNSQISKGSQCLAIFYDESVHSNIVDILLKTEAKSVETKYFDEEFVQEINKKYMLFKEAQEDMFKKYHDTLVLHESKLRVIYKLLDVESVLISQDDGYILSGWIPKKEKENFTKHLKTSKAKFNDAKIVAPVLLKTPKIFKPFEELIENFSYPNYTEINPTVLFAFTFLCMFGMMFGDVGHGAVLSTFGYVLLKKTQDYKVLAQIMISTGISAMFFGFLYSSIFGFHDILPHILFIPMENVSKILSISLVIGFLIITLSMALNIFSRFKNRDFFRLFFGSGGVLWLLVYWFLIGIAVKYILYNLSVIIEVYILITILLILFFMFLYKSKDIAKSIIQTTIEVMEYATNTLSFIRLGAFTLSHAALFLALFSIADLISQNTQTGVGYWISMIVGNIIIIVLEGVVVAIQTLRLEYYEFFKRFYSGGGERYLPFRLKEDEDENFIHV